MADEKKQPLSNAERARNYRQRKREEREAAAAAERDADTERDADAGTKRVSMRAELDASLKAMKWLKPSDKAATAVATMLADQIDHQLEQDATQTNRVTALSHALMRALHEIGGTPTVRLQHELRSLRVAAGLEPEGEKNGESNERSTQASKPGEATVSDIRRPPKRKRPA